MPLVIPGERNLSAETFTSYLLGLQANKKRREEEEAQEAAADAQGNTALAGGVGMALGALLAIPTGGASLALAAGATATGAAAGVATGAAASIAAGAAIGGGIGTALGGAVFGKDAGPGFQQQAIAQGLSQATKGVIQLYAIEADEIATEEEKAFAFNTKMADLNVTGFSEFRAQKIKQAKDSGLAPPSASHIRTAFSDTLAERNMQGMNDFKRGQVAAAKLGVIDANKITAFRDAPRHPSRLPNGADNPEAGMPMGFTPTPGQLQTGQRLLATIDSLDAEIAASNRPEPGLQNALAKTRSKFNNMGLRVRRTPTPARTLQQQQKTGQPGKSHTRFEDETRPGIYGTYTTGGVLSMHADAGAEMVVPAPEGGSTTFGYEPKTLKPIFRFRTYGNKMKVGAGVTHVDPNFPELGPLHYNDKGLPVYTSKDDPNKELISDTYTNTFEASIKSNPKGGITAASKVASQAAEDMASFIEERSLSERNKAASRDIDKFRIEIEQARTGGEVLKILDTNNKVFADARRVMLEPDKFSPEIVRRSAVKIARIIQSLFADTRLSPAVEQQIAEQLVQVANIKRQAGG